LKLKIPIARIFKPLLKPSRYKCVWGGRGSAKSHVLADRIIARSASGGTRQVCIREVQKSLKESAKRLIEDKLETHKLGESHGFRIYREHIETPGNGIITFQGMQDSTAESIKSLEGFTTAWVEEAQTLSERSLELLRPTIRTPGSELWFSFNPRFKTDAVDILFRQQTPPTGSIIIESNWSDNPWFPAVLEQERLDCLQNNPDSYAHIWEGDYVGISKGAYYARHLAEAKDRIGIVSADPLLPVKLFCDIGGTGGKSDAFAIWAAQFVGQEIRVLNYYEAQGQDLGTHLAWMRSEGYTADNAEIWLPHDGATNDRVFDVSYESAFKRAGYRVEVVPNQGKGAAAKRIEEVRHLFPQMWFNRKTCAPGLETLGWYHEKIDPVRRIGLGPEHNFASHGSDAFGLLAVVYKLPKGKSKTIRFAGWG